VPKPPSGPIDLDVLRSKLSGALVTPNQSAYATARLSYDQAFDSRRPAAVAQCTSASDVQACVDAAAKAHSPIAARSGGHSYIGASTPDGALVVDLAKLNSIAVHPDGTVTIGPGARLGDVYTALAAAGRCLPGGSCPTVGLGGLALGGGVGVLARKYGLTCDHLISASVVTADATTRTTDAAQEPDLFWALRGGGGGHSGITTSFTFSTVPAPELTVFFLQFPSGSAAAVFGAWQGWIADAQPEVWSNIAISTGSAPGASVAGCFVGTSAELAPLLDALVRHAGVQPGSRSATSMGYLNAMHHFAGSSARQTFAATSRIIGAPLKDASSFVQACTRGTGTVVIVDAIGGNVGSLAPAATAFPHRSALATVQVYRGTTVAGYSSAVTEVTAVRDALTGVVGPGAYVNYLDTTTPVEDYYGANLGRLRQVAGHYDPSGIFGALGG
jgi:FAD/FMN-containing dehydrogenase